MPSDWDTVAADARRVLRGNRQRGISAWDGRSYAFVCPSPTTYPFQWFWDSAFHAIALLHVDPELAKQEIRCLMQGARARRIHRRQIVGFRVWTDVTRASGPAMTSQTQFVPDEDEGQQAVEH
jgi:hypothetical protein